MGPRIEFNLSGSGQSSNLVSMKRLTADGIRVYACNRANDEMERETT